MTREEHLRAIRAFGPVKRGKRHGMLMLCSGPDCAGAEVYAAGLSLADALAAGSAHINAAEAEAGDGAPWIHGTRLGREHRSVREHLVEDHGIGRGQVDGWSDGAVHGHHDGVHRETWAYAADLPHPAPGDTPSDSRDGR